MVFSWLERVVLLLLLLGLRIRVLDALWKTLAQYNRL